MDLFRRIDILLSTLALAIAAPLAGAATLRAEVSPDTVYLGDAFTLAVTLDAAAAPASAPSIANASGCAISAPQLLNQSIRRAPIINGKRTEDVVERVSWIYAVRPETAGVLALGEASLEADGRRLTTRIPDVKVVGPEPQPWARVALSASRDAVLLEETFDVVLDVTLARLPGDHAAANPIAEGENAPHLDIPLFIEGGVAGCAFGRPLDGFLGSLLAERAESGGFRINDYSAPAQTSLFDLFGGRAPAVFHLERTAVELEGRPAWRYRLAFPFKAVAEGTCRFPPVRFKGHVFVADAADAQPKPQVVFAVSEPLTVAVTSPPAEGRPVSFIGSLGTRMEAAVSLDVQSCNEGDPIKLALDIVGDQTLTNMKAPRIFENTAMAERFRGYGDVGAEPIAAGMRYIYKIRPITSGTIEVPVLELAFFNTDRREYEIVRTAPVPLRVNPAAQLDPDAIYGIATNAARASLSVEADLVPSALTLAPAPATSSRIRGRGAWLAVLAAPPAFVALVAAFFAFWRRRRAMGAMLRRRSARGRATRRILHAKTPQGVMDAVGVVLRDRFGERGAGFTPADVHAILLRQGADSATAEEIARLLQEVFNSGFTPGGDPAGTVAKRRARLAEMFAALKTVALVCLLGGLAPSAEGADASASFAWRQAASAAAQAQRPEEFRRAAMLYRERVDGNGPNASALYNYGTLLLLAEHPREAFDALSRAEALLGATPEIENNLALAWTASRRSGDDGAVAGQGGDAAANLPWYRVPLFWHYRAPLHVRVEGFVAAWWVLWAGVLLRRLRLRRTGAAVALAAAVVAALLATSVVASHRILAAPIPDVPEADAGEGGPTR